MLLFPLARNLKLNKTHFASCLIQLNIRSPHFYTGQPFPLNKSSKSVPVHFAWNFSVYKLTLLNFHKNQLYDLPAKKYRSRIKSVLGIS